MTPRSACKVIVVAPSAAAIGADASASMPCSCTSLAAKIDRTKATAKKVDLNRSLTPPSLLTAAAPNREVAGCGLAGGGVGRLAPAPFRPSPVVDFRAQIQHGDR